MNECDQTCDMLREDLGRLRTHKMQMKANARCALTDKLVLGAGEPFYVFPSGYVLLESALKSEVMPSLNDKQRGRVEEIDKQMQELRRRKNKESDVDRLQSELDGLIAAECPLTGSMIVDSIDVGFPESVGMDEAFTKASEWIDSSALEMSSSSASKVDEKSYVGVSSAPDMKL